MKLEEQDFMDNIDDELLELAGAGEKKRKRRSAHSPKSSASKKRKADPMETDSDIGVESEEDVDPYPLEGKYADEGDRQRLLQMSEFEREAILATRVEEKQRLADKRILSQMVKNQRAGPDTDSVAQAAKRQHTARGATKEKARTLDEYKAKRRANDEKKRSRKYSPNRERSTSPMDMEMSDEESEDGQITKLEQEEEKERRLLNRSEPLDEPITMIDLEKCRLTRDMLAKYCMAPWFEDYVRGAWVRYLIGQENGQPVYRICEVHNLAADLVKPYKINEKTVNQAFELKHGKSIRVFNMDKVSNGPFIDKEYERLVIVCTSEDIKLPTKRHIEDKLTKLQKLITQPMTERDISAILARKSQLQSNKPTGLTTMERSRLNQARTLAYRRHDYEEVASIDAKLEELGAGTESQRHDKIDLLALVNERNRKANLDAVRKAELVEAERKRRDRKLAALGGTLTPQDPSARLKTVPRMFNSATPLSRPGTPLTPNTRPVSPLPPSAKPNGLEPTLGSSVIDTLEVDLGDF